MFMCVMASVPPRGGLLVAYWRFLLGFMLFVLLYMYAVFIYLFLV
jgi:hypothetical protein